MVSRSEWGFLSENAGCAWQLETRYQLRSVNSKPAQYNIFTTSYYYVQFTSKEFIPRTSEMYDYHCSMLDSPLYKEDSTTYGINFNSPLNQLSGFHVVDQLPQDIMHVLLEGVIPYELSLMLAKFITILKYFKLDHLNDQIACFAFSMKKQRIGHHLLDHNSCHQIPQFISHVSSDVLHL